MWLNDSFCEGLLKEAKYSPRLTALLKRKGKLPETATSNVGNPLDPATANRQNRSLRQQTGDALKLLNRKAVVPAAVVGALTSSH